MADERGSRRRRTVLQSLGAFGTLGVADVVSLVAGETTPETDDRPGSVPSAGGSGNDVTTGSTNTFTHDCSNLDPLSPNSDTAALTVDTSNSQYFPAPEGWQDTARITRSWTTGDVALAYKVPVIVDSLTLQFHKHGGDGWVNVYASFDEGQSWYYVDTSADTYGGVDGGWIHHEITTDDISSDATDIKLVLTGGAEPWTTQLGHVSIQYSLNNAPPAPWRSP
jgi:hypothetical protein